MLWEKGQLESAAEALESATRHGASASVWFDLGLVRQDLKDFAGAAAAFQHVLRESPDNAAARVNLGVVLQEQGFIEAAIEAYSLAYRQEPSTLGTIAMALTSARTGRAWLDLEALKRLLAG